MKFRFNRDMLILQILWIAGYLNIQYLDYSVKENIRMFVALGCGLYLVSKSVEKKDLFRFLCFPAAIIITSAYNCIPKNLVRFRQGTVFALLIFELLCMIKMVGKQMQLKYIARSLLKTSIIYLIPTVISVFILGNNISNAEGVYFIGTKFSVAYFFIIVICLLGLSEEEKKASSWSFGLPFWVFVIIGVGVALYMKAYTGTIMMLFVATLTIVNKYFIIHKSKDIGILTILRRPFIASASIIISGGFIYFAQSLLQNPKIYEIIDSWNKTGTMQSRLLIYENLLKIIGQRMFWGYGHGSMIVSEYYGVNPQNGLARIIIYYGLLGAVAFIYLVFSCINRGKVHDAKSDLILFCIYSFVLASTVEVCYSYQIFILLAFYIVRCEQNEAQLV